MKTKDKESSERFRSIPFNGGTQGKILRENGRMVGAGEEEGILSSFQKMHWLLLE